MKSYSIMARMMVDINRSIRAESLQDAMEQAKQLRVTDFVATAKGADIHFNDYTDFEVYGVFKE